MPDAVENDYVISIPGDFYLLPVVGTESDEYLDSLAAAFELPEDATTRLRFGLGNVTRVAHSNPDNSRSNWALISSPDSGRVDALLTLAFRGRDDESAERFRESASSEHQDQDSVELINRNVNDYEFPAGSAVVVHDFVLPRNTGGVSDPAVERCIVALFAPGLDRSLEFSIVTQDLQLFEDMTDYLLKIVAQVRVAASGDAE